MRKGHPLPALPSYNRSTIRNSFLPVFDPAEMFKAEASRINAKGLEGPDRSQAVSDAPQDADRREKIRLRLCDDNGWVSNFAIKEDVRVETLDKSYLDRFNRLYGRHLPILKPFLCTGSAHLAGEVFTCTSPAHVGVGMAYAEVARTIREARRERAGLPHHVKAGDPSGQRIPFGTVGPVPVDDFWKDVQEVTIQEPGDWHGFPVFTDDVVPVTHLVDGTVRLDATPQEVYAAARKYPGDDDHLRLHQQRLQQLTPAEAEAMTTFTWGPGSAWGHPSGFFANYDEYVAARKSGWAKLRAVAAEGYDPGEIKPYGYWKGEELVYYTRPGEESAVLASLSDDVERIKACREPRTPSPDPQCSGPGWAKYLWSRP